MPPRRDGQAARHLLWSGLVLLWSVDALLKLQPRMFSAEFFVNVLGPIAADGQPAWLYHLLTWFDDLWVGHMVVGDLLVFAVEAGIAALLWFGPERRAGRLGLVALVVWAAVVWVFGEGFGGLFTGDPSVLSEAPGAAILYAAMAVLLLGHPAGWRDGRYPSVLRLGVGLLWILAALLEATPDFWTGPGLARVFGDVTMNGTLPAWAAFLNNLMILSTFHHAPLWNALFVVVMGSIGLAVLGGRTGRCWTVLVLAWTSFLWIFPQAFGGLTVGTATDPGTAPLLCLVTLAALLPNEPSVRSSSPPPGGRLPDAA